MGVWILAGIKRCRYCGIGKKNRCIFTSEEPKSRFQQERDRAKPASALKDIVPDSKLRPFLLTTVHSKDEGFCRHKGAHRKEESNLTRSTADILGLIPSESICMRFAKGQKKGCYDVVGEQTTSESDQRTEAENKRLDQKSEAEDLAGFGIPHQRRS